MDISKPSRGRKADPKRAAALEKWACGVRGLDRWNAVAREVGEAVPWDGTPSEMIAWCRRHQRKVPRWMTDAAAGPIVPQPVPPSAPAPRKSTPAISADASPTDPVAVLDGLLADVLAKIERGRAEHADPAALASWGKDYANLLKQRNQLETEMRAKDDGLVPKADVIQFIDTVHAAIPGRIETALLNAKQEAAAALAADEWPDFCEKFIASHLAEVARQHFGVTLPAAA